ncbi:MAG TPA: hypothetical protein VKK31_12285 [Thermoanaerobaculia bacterium]|nr:hypothetical protein [Thermoanaerobaculia bacterium]
MRNHLSTLFSIAVLLLVVGCKTTPPPPPVAFAQYGAAYAAKPDFARVELDHPLSSQDRAAITPENLRALTQEQVDQIYARLTAGPIPDGPYKGDLFFAEGGGLKRVSEVLGGVRGFANDLGLKKLELIGSALWKGKVFYRDQRELRNIIEKRSIVARAFDVDTKDMRTGQYDGKTVGLLFPAKLYCGQSLLDSRRESVIIDYAFGDDLDGYLPKVDSVAGRNGLQVRDEIRRVRPGFYLGRAYMGRAFVLNFTLYNEAEAKTGKDSEDCWNGTPERPRQVADSH